MTLAQIWDALFSSFTVFVGVGLLWLGLIERRIPSRSLSVSLMIIVAIAAAGVRFWLAWRKAHRDWIDAQAQIEAADAQFEEVG
jgi:hypothetical protein